MYEFHAEGDGALTLTADFASVPYANISFFDAARADVLFHVSLRADASIAVFNRRSGGVWQAERSVAVDFLPGQQAVSFRFGVGGALVTLNGRAIFDLAAAEVAGAEAIAWQEVTGGFDPMSFVVTGAANTARRGQGGLVYVAPFGIAGWGLDPALARQDLTVNFALLTDPPMVMRRPRPDLIPSGGNGAAPIAIEAELPGRIWADLPPGAALTIHLLANGQSCGNLTLTRPQFAAALDLMLSQPGAAEAHHMAILALEHVHHGGFWPDLGPAARGALRQIAQRLRLQALLPAPDDPPAPAALVLDGSLADQAFQHLAATFRAAPGQDLATLLDQAPPLPPGARRRLLILLTDLFCAQGQFGALHTVWAQEGHALAADPGDGWGRSIQLPYLLASGQHGRLLDAFWRVSGDAASWISTAAVAWVMKQACDPVLDLPWREDLVFPFLDLLTRRAADYWGRVSDVRLIRAMVDLLVFAPHLPDWLEPRVLDTALATYGLTPGFWTMVDLEQAEGRLSVSPKLAAARMAYGVIHGRANGRAGPQQTLDAAFALFDRLGAPDAARMRREMLGPLGLTSDGTLGVDLPLHLHGQAESAGATVLRALAFPADPPLLSEPMARDLSPLLRRTIAAAHGVVPHAPLHRLQVQISQQIAALLASAEVPGPHQLDHLFGDLALLENDTAPQKVQGLGIALGLAALDGMLRRGWRDAALDLLIRLQRLCAALPDEARRALPGSLAMQNALAALLARSGPDPLALALAESLAPATLPALPVDPSPGLDTPPLFDVLVIVVSCLPYLNSRIPAMRAAWLDRLTDLGLPWIVAVGGAQGAARIEGQVLHLNCPDDYEGLPQKVLAAFDWSARNTRAAHVLKIDDDCFIDTDAFFHAQTWRKFAYYGRKLTREPGQMDRAWHQAKSTTARGRLELDKSPEPSTYCDGGSGYFLSRQAMAALAEQRSTLPGQRLIQASFMEDKLIGDLLAMAGIAPEDEDYLVAIQRRGHSGATPVSLWSNSFFPSQASGVKLVHLDRTEGQTFAAALRDRPALWPPKIWPSYAAPSLVYNTNLLDLVSPIAKLQVLNAAALAVVGTMRNEMFMLPHFLAHYRGLGVKAFLIADNLSDDGTLDYLLSQPDVVTFSVDSDYRVSEYGVAWQQAILSNLRVGRWSLVADADELLVTGQDGPLTDIVAGLGDADAVRMFMLDMYPEGPLSSARFQQGGPFAEAGFCDAVPFRADWPGRGPFGDQDTWTSSLRHRLIPGSRPDLFVAQKVALLKYQPWMRLSAGLHYVGDARLAAREMIFAHFKYNAEFSAKVRAEVARRQHFNDAEEYRRYQALLQEGREVIFDPAISVPWLTSPAVRKVLRLGAHLGETA